MYFAFGEIFSILLLVIIIDRNGLICDRTTLRQTGHGNRRLTLTRQLSNDQFTASSFRDGSSNFRPHYAKLLDVSSTTDPTDGRAWCPLYQVHDRPTEWIEVDFQRMVILEHLFTMGRGSGPVIEYTPEIQIQYKRAESDEWITYQDEKKLTIFPINTDPRNKQRLALKTIVARKVRLFPLARSLGPMWTCIKFAFLGLYMKDEVVSYSVPQGDQKEFNYNLVNLHDDAYDGKKSGQNLIGGLGVLMDNDVWKNQYNFKTMVENDWTHNFMGWKCYKKRKNITIMFHYTEERIFHSLDLYGVQDLTNSIVILNSIVITIYSNWNDVSSTSSSIQLNKTQKLPQHDQNHLVISSQLNKIKGRACAVTFHCTEENWILLSEVRIVSDQTPQDIVPEFQNGGTTKMVDLNNDKYINVSYRYTTNIKSDSTYKNIHDTTFLISVTIATAVVTLLISCMLLLFYKIRRDRQRNKLNKKFQLIAHGKSSTMPTAHQHQHHGHHQIGPHSLCPPTNNTIFTIHSKNPPHSCTNPRSNINHNTNNNSNNNNNPNNTKLMVNSDSKSIITGVYSGSQNSDGVYGTWPNTDEDMEASLVQHGPEPRTSVVDSINKDDVDVKWSLLQVDSSINNNVKNSCKEYTTYQPSGHVTSVGGDYYTDCQPQSTLSSSRVYQLQRPPSLSSPAPQFLPTNCYYPTNSEPLLDTNLIPMTPSQVPYPNSLVTRVKSHLALYKGVCGDVDLRYSFPLTQKTDSHNNAGGTQFDPDIKIIQASSLNTLHVLTSSQYGNVEVCKFRNNGPDSSSALSTYLIVKRLNPDISSMYRTHFIQELKILSSIVCDNFVRFHSLAVEVDPSRGSDSTTDPISMIKSASFRIVLQGALIANGGSYNLKEFLKNSSTSSTTLSMESNNHGDKRDMKKHQTQLTLLDQINICCQISNAAQYLNKLGVCHRDLGCRNCTIDPLTSLVKLYPGGIVSGRCIDDYCCVDLSNHGNKSANGGTIETIHFPLRFMAPETILSGTWSSESEMWSMGVCIWEVLIKAQYLPYPSIPDDTLIDLMSSVNSYPKLCNPQTYSSQSVTSATFISQLYQLIQQATQYDPIARPQFNELHEILLQNKCSLVQTRINKPSQINNSYVQLTPQIFLPGPPPTEPPISHHQKSILPASSSTSNN